MNSLTFNPYFDLIATKEHMFFSLCVAIVVILSEKSDIKVNGRTVTPKIWIVAYNQSGTGKSIPLDIILKACNDDEDLRDRVVTTGTHQGLVKSMSDTKTTFVVLDEMHAFLNRCGCQSKVILIAAGY